MNTMVAVIAASLLTGCATTFTGMCALKALAQHGDTHYFATHCQATEK